MSSTPDNVSVDIEIFSENFYLDASGSSRPAFFSSKNGMYFLNFLEASDHGGGSEEIF